MFICKLFCYRTKDLSSAIVQNDKLPIDPYGNSFEQDSRDVYDFHDSDMEEDCLKLIDVAPGDLPTPKKEKKAGIKMRLPGKFRIHFFVKISFFHPLIHQVKDRFICLSIFLDTLYGT